MRKSSTHTVFLAAAALIVFANPMNGEADENLVSKKMVDADDHALLVRLETFNSMINAKKQEFKDSFQISESRLSEHMFFGGLDCERNIVRRLLRALVLQDSFVIAIAGMSDTAGHGNMFEDSYPLVLKRILAPMMAHAAIKFDVRNMAVGGMPSYPGSVCMADILGHDSDVVMWDFRMVESEQDALKGEIFLRQAMLHPRQPFVVFKRANSYLKSFQRYFNATSLQVIDERSLIKFISKHPNMTVRNLVANDNFCSGADPTKGKVAPCECPGQVRWHAGYKIHRIRGIHWAMIYLTFLEKAVLEFIEMLQKGIPSGSIRDQQRKILENSVATELPEPYSNECEHVFCSVNYHCVTTGEPRMGLSMLDVLDSNETKWKLSFPDSRIEGVTSQGHEKCHYLDAKKSLFGDVNSGWVFFRTENEIVDDNGINVVAFCGDFPQDDGWITKVLILLNGEEIQNSLKPWLQVKTLGMRSMCYSNSVDVVGGQNIIGFRVMEEGIQIRLTHLLWH